MSRQFAERLKALNTLGTPGVYRVVNSWVEGPPALGHRRVLLFTGCVVSTKMAKTVNVEVSQFVLHPKLKKFVRRTSKLMAHDEFEEARWGDVVEVRECRPLSKRKRFVLHRIVKPRPQVDWGAETPQPLTYRTIAQQVREATRQAQEEGGKEGAEGGMKAVDASARGSATVAAAAREKLWDKEAEYAVYRTRKASYDSYRRKMETALIARK